MLTAGSPLLSWSTVLVVLVLTVVAAIPELDSRWRGGLLTVAALLTAVVLGLLTVPASADLRGDVADSFRDGYRQGQLNVEPQP